MSIDLPLDTTRSLEKLRVLRTFLLAPAIAIWLTNAMYAQSDSWDLNFPDESNVGVIEAHPSPSLNQFGYAEWPRRPQRTETATGTLTFEDGDFLVLKLNGDSSNDLGFLKKLTADAIGGLELTGCSLGSDKFEIISRLENLKFVRLDNCSIDPNLQLEELAVSNSMEQITCQLPTDADGEVGRLACWASRCPDLRVFYCSNRYLNAGESSRFANHPKITFLSVNIDSDVSALCQGLQSMPRLRGLNVLVSDDVEDDYSTHLSSLDQIELLNWSSGTLDAGVMRALGKMDGLRKLRIQGAAIIAEDFAEGLIELSNLRGITIRPRVNHCPDEKIHEVLCQLIQLKDWPELKNPSAQALQAVSKCAGRTSVSINGIGANASIEDLAGAISDPSIQFLELKNVPLTQVVVRAIQNCTRLENLSLSSERIVGPIFENPESFTELEGLSIHATTLDGNLNSLAALPSLEQVNLFINSMSPKDLAFIAGCKNLTSLSVLGGFSDDSTAVFIGEHKSLSHVSLGQDCFMTDKGIESLCRNPNLESLSIAGFITSSSARSLDKLPRLRWLSIWSDLISVEERKLLESHFGHLKHNDFREFYPSTGKVKIGNDGIWRLTTDDGRDEFDAIEGKPISELLGDHYDEALQNELKGKVVLIDFWGTWCGPCLAMKPTLAKIRDKHQQAGFVLLSVHSSRGLDELDAFIQDHPLEWTNLKDADSKLQESFHVKTYPTFYLVDAQGKLRAAHVHRIRLDEAVEQLLPEE